MQVRGAPWLVGCLFIFFVLRFAFDVSKSLGFIVLLPRLSAPFRGTATAGGFTFRFLFAEPRSPFAFELGVERPLYIFTKSFILILPLK